MIKKLRYGLPEPNASKANPATIGPVVHPAPKRGVIDS
jgi:hypothetical protein